jgi:SAM-dependent methyltransferase
LLRDHVVCARCRANLELGAIEIVCTRCSQRYPRVGRIPVLLPRPDDHVDLWRQQLGLLIAHGRHTLASAEAQAASPGLLPCVRTRLCALAHGVQRQLDDIVTLVGPALGGPRPARSCSGLPRGVVDYASFLYRDWAWESAGHDENRSAVEAIRSVLGAEHLGRVLVLGAGGCRLAYDLHRLAGTETMVVDIDPFLFLIAEAVIRGERLRLTEATANVQDLAHVATSWDLTAPDGPLDDECFHFLLANGLAPPLADGVFDTVVTPWFIDQVPTDLPRFLAVLRRVLGPRGRWINQGPLVYPAEAPLSRRFSRDEVFELAGRAGFRVAEWSCESRPYLVSPINGRGKVEPVLTFVALAGDCGAG